MPAHTIKRRVSYSARQLFDLVADVECYPEFLPWCKKSRIIRRQDNEIIVEVAIGYKILSESFVSRDILTPPDETGVARIDVEYCDGPFRHLHNSWVFTPDAGPNGEAHCVVDFDIDFEFRSPLFRRMMGALFHEAVRRMVDCFERRARDIYGP